jgi:HAD superfamily hydrolase (TIGR01509 family)
MNQLRALLWDVDGTIAETEADGHRVAFNRAFEAHRLPWRWDLPTYGRLLDVTGGRERLLAFMRGRDDVPATPAAREALARALHATKNQAYADLIAQGGIAARPGVRRLMSACQAEGVAMSVVTTTSTVNVEALFTSLFGKAWRQRFAAVVCAEDAPVKKPDPQAYLLALQRLGVAPHEAFAIEDSPNGLAAARAAGIPCGIARSAYFADARFDGAIWVRDSLDVPAPMTLNLLRSELSGKIVASATLRESPLP